MRLWSLHPKYLDAKGLVALWRESLLAQNVLLGKTKGYKNHPQLERFKQNGQLGYYLQEVHSESKQRNYKFNENKIIDRTFISKIPVTTKQMEYEFQHLLNKLHTRDNKKYMQIKNETSIQPHPLFHVVEGEIESWEIIREV